MNLIENKARSLNTFGLMMIAIITVDGIRNLPINAQFGLPLIILFAFAGITFFLPIIILTAKLSSHFPQTGGSYLWIRQAFGTRWGFVSIWLQWVYNMLWYPTIFVFIATTIAALFGSTIKVDPSYTLWVSLGLFWLITLMSCLGIRAVSSVSTLCAILGTLLPMALIIGLAAIWLLSGKPSSTPLSWQGLIPDHKTFGNLAFFVNVLFSLMGIDILGMHAGNIKNPKKKYASALGWSGIIIILSMSLSSLALCILLTPKQLELISGLTDGAAIFFNAYNMSWGTPLMSGAIVLGCFGVASSWIIGLGRGLQVAARDVNLPQILQKVNRFDMPYIVLLIQAMIVTLLFAIYTLLPGLNAFYWILSAMSSQLALGYYILLFAAAYKLLKKEVARGVYLLFFLGILTALIGIIVGFLPPENVAGYKNIFHYELPILATLGLALLPLYFLFKKIREA